MINTQILEAGHKRWTRTGSVVSELIVLVLIIVAIVGAVAGKFLVTALCGLVLVVTIVSRIWARLALVDVDYQCSPSSERLIAGDVIELTLTVENRKPLPVPWLSVSEALPDGLEHAGDDRTVQGFFKGSEIRNSASLAQYERVKFRHRLRAARRGHYAFGPTRIVSGDIFGFYEARLDSPRRPPSVVVYPRTVPLPDFHLPSRRPIGDSWSRSRLVDDPTRPSGLREYQSGDAARQIDWKATARRGEVFVRTYDSSIVQRVVILAECNTSREVWRTRPAILEAVVTGAASVAERSIELGYAVGIVSNGNVASELAPPMVAPGAGPDQLTALMTTLAGAGMMKTQPLEELIERYGAEAMPAGATVVFVAGLFRPSTVDFVADLARRGHQVVTLYVGDDDPPEIQHLPILDYRAVFAAPENADA